MFIKVRTSDDFSATLIDWFLVSEVLTGGGRQPDRLLITGPRRERKHFTNEKEKKIT